jgi:hypothetical protein
VSVASAVATGAVVNTDPRRVSLMSLVLNPTFAAGQTAKYRLRVNPR